MFSLFLFKTQDLNEFELNQKFVYFFKNYNYLEEAVVCGAEPPAVALLLVPAVPRLFKPFLNFR